MPTFRMNQGSMPNADYYVVDDLERVHDIRMVRPPEVQGISPVHGNSGELGIALIEYCFQVPANRIGHAQFSAAQLKTIQEVISLVVFSIFSVVYLKEAMKWNYVVGFALIVVAVADDVSSFKPQEIFKYFSSTYAHVVRLLRPLATPLDHIYIAPFIHRKLEEFV